MMEDSPGILVDLVVELKRLERLSNLTESVRRVKEGARYCGLYKYWHDT